MGMYEDSSGSSATQAEKEEVDSRSIYVGNVRAQNLFPCFRSYMIYHVFNLLLLASYKFELSYLLQVFALNP